MLEQWKTVAKTNPYSLHFGVHFTGTVTKQYWDVETPCIMAD
jgi:hypothetical protein